MPTNNITRKITSTNQHGGRNTQATGTGSSRERRMKREEEEEVLRNRTSVKSSGNIFTPEKKGSKEHSSPRSISAFPSGTVRAKRIAVSTVRRTSSSDALFLPQQSDHTTDTAVTDRIVRHVNKGCEEFRCGRHEEAMKCFHQACCLLRVKETTGSLDDNLDVSRTAYPEVSCCKDNYIYQRLEFDEGMRTFSEPLKIDRNDGMNMESVIFYNKGQVYMHFQSWEKARLCFVSAIEREASNNLSFLHIASLQCIGQIQYYLGKYEDASVSYKNSIRHAKDLYGRTHLTIAAALNSLSVICYHMLSLSSPLNSNTDNTESSAETSYLNLLQKAKDYSKRSLSIRIKLLDQNHKDIATSYNNSGRLYVMQGEFQKALECYEKALEIRAELLGKDSLDYAATAFNTGQSYHHIRNLPKAMHYYKEFLSVAQRKFSKNHRDVAVVLSGMAEIHQELGEMDQALQLYEESLQVGRNALGDDHPEIAMILNRLGNFHFSSHNYDAAFDAYSRGLEIERKASDDANCIVSLCNLGEIHRQRKEWDAAIRTFKDALKIQKKYLGDKIQCAKLANTLHVIGITYDKKGDSDSGLRYLQEALIMKRSSLGEKHIDVTPTLTSIGIMFFRENRLSLALDLLQESLHIRRAKLGPNNRDVAFTLYNIALVQLKMDSLTEAINCLTEVLRIEKNILGEDHKDVAITLFKLGETFQKHNELDSALRCFKDALNIERKVMLKSDPLTVARTLQEIGNIHLYLGNTHEMMEAFIEAARIYQESSMDLNSVMVSKHLYAIGLSCPKAAAAA